MKKPSNIADKWLDRMENRLWVDSLPTGLHLYRKINILIDIREIALNGLPRDWTLDRTRTEGIKDRTSPQQSLTMAILAVREGVNKPATLQLAQKHPGDMQVALQPGTHVFVVAYYDRGASHPVKKWGQIG